MLSVITVLAHGGWDEVLLLGALPLAIIAVWHTVERRWRASRDEREEHGSSGR
jgi:hypothetical protein